MEEGPVYGVGCRKLNELQQLFSLYTNLPKAAACSHAERMQVWTQSNEDQMKIYAYSSTRILA